MLSTPTFSRQAYLQQAGSMCYKELIARAKINGIKKPRQKAGFYCKHEITYSWLLYQFRG